MEVALADCCRCRASGTRIMPVLAASKPGAAMADLKTIRTDVIGSLLRPPGLREARIRFDNGQLTAEALRVVEDAAVRGAVRLQESVGLDVVTDGEMRRLNFQDSFGAAVEGFDAERSTIQSNERRVAGATPARGWDIPDMPDRGTAATHPRPAKGRLSASDDNTAE